MKVAVVVNELNIRGGTHKQVLRFCEYLKRNKIDFKIYTKYFNPELTYTEFKKLDVVYLKKDATKFYDSKGSIIKKIKNRLSGRKEERDLYRLIPKDVDIVNIHDNGFPYLIKLSKKHRKKVVWQINDLPGCYGVGVSQYGSGNIILSIKKIFYRRLAQKVDCITVNVTKNKKRIQQCMGAEAEVLYCGVDVNDMLIKHTFPENIERFRLLSTGVFFAYRNYETLVDVVEKMKNDNMPIYLDIIGSTASGKEYAQKIKTLVSGKKLDNYIKIWGQVDDDKYNELYNEANAFAFVNIDQSWGLAVFEAMSCGLPTIVSESVGAVELLHDNQDSIIVNPLAVDEICNILKRLMYDKEYYKKISTNAIEAAKDYSWDQLYSSKLLNIFYGLK